MKGKKRKIPIYTLRQIQKRGYPKGPWKVAKRDRMLFEKMYMY